MSNKTESGKSKLIVEKEYFESVLKKRIAVGSEIYERQIQTNRQLEQARSEYGDWNDYNSEFLKQSFDNPNSEYKISYDRVNDVGFYVAMDISPAEQLREFKDDVKNKVNNLNRLLSKVDLIEVASGIPTIKTKQTNTAPNEKVFIVHGHNNEVKLEVARTLEKLGLLSLIHI